MLLLASALSICWPNVLQLKNLLTNTPHPGRLPPPFGGQLVIVKFIDNNENYMLSISENTLFFNKCYKDL